MSGIEEEMKYIRNLLMCYINSFCLLLLILLILLISKSILQICDIFVSLFSQAEST